MKKILIGLSLVLIMLSVFAFKKTNNKAHVVLHTSGSVVNVTLNGVDEKKAKAMICQFNMIKSNDRRPKQTMVYFDINKIRAIVTLLESEQQAQLKTKKPGDNSMTGVTDGIRIYFACDNSVNAQHPLDTKVLLVSTKENGPSQGPGCWSKKLHQDYYDHTVDPTTLKDGDVHHEGRKCQGLTLYNCFKCAIENTKCTTPTPNGGVKNNIPGIRAKAMVELFRGHAINSASVWFNLGMFKKLVDMYPKRTTGMRIYFATHLPFDKDAGGRDAMIIVPTEHNRNTGYEDDYFDCKGEDSYWADYLKLYHANPYTGNALDNAELCPDNCN